jgi:hypothetical protein
MENRNSLTPFAVTPSVLVRPAAARPRIPVDSRVLTAILWFFAAGTIFSCCAAVPDIDRAGTTPYGALVKQHEADNGQALRVQVDATRKRLWVLGMQNAYVYDIDERQLIRRIALPARSVAGIQCAPDLILDRSGNAFISSNAEPRLWQISAADFSIKEHAIRMVGKEGWDSGFGALAFSADGTLFGLSAFAGTLWRIDPARSSASQVALSGRVLNTCSLNTPRETVPPTQPHAVTLCAVGAKDTRRIAISPDLSRGRVLNEACAP